MDKLTLNARVAQEGNSFTATIDNLSPMGRGPSVKEAQDDLVEKFKSWLQTCDGQGTLEATLSAVGYDGVDEDTELELQFVE